MECIKNLCEDDFTVVRCGDKILLARVRDRGQSCKHNKDGLDFSI